MENRHIAFSPPDITEEEITEVVDTLKSGWITTGPKTKKFEKKLAEYIGTNKVVCLNSATACAEMILRVLGIGEGDEVITTAYTYTATASVIAHVGAKIVMVDVKKDSYQMDMNQVEAAVTEKTKAIIMVDLGGRICDYTRAFEIAEEKIEEELKKMSEAYKMEVDKIKEALGESGLDQMKAELKIQAAVDFIRDKATEVEKKAEEAEEKKED